jgi:hypothetical protein
MRGPHRDPRRTAAPHVEKHNRSGRKCHQQGAEYSEEITEDTGGNRQSKGKPQHGQPVYGTGVADFFTRTLELAGYSGGLGFIDKLRQSAKGTE